MVGLTPYQSWYNNRKSVPYGGFIEAWNSVLVSEGVGEDFLWFLSLDSWCGAVLRSWGMNQEEFLGFSLTSAKCMAFGKSLSLSLCLAMRTVSNTALPCRVIVRPETGYCLNNWQCYTRETLIIACFKYFSNIGMSKLAAVEIVPKTSLHLVTLPIFIHFLSHLSSKEHTCEFPPHSSSWQCYEEAGLRTSWPAQIHAVAFITKLLLHY